MDGALSDIRVLDFGRFIAGPYCGAILADMGAEVIRIERPGGEEDRTVGLRGPSGENSMFLNCARNKKAITLNLLGDANCKPILAELLAHADVLLHNFSPGAAERMGLTYDDVRAIKPDIIYTSVSCYGSTGPYSRRIGFDPIAQTVSGAAAINGFEGGPPMRSQLPWVDFSTAVSAAAGTLAALRHRDKTGVGQAVDCALLRTAVSFMAPIIAEETTFGRPRPRTGNRAAYMGPSDLYACTDGHVYIATIMDTQWRRLLEAVGAEDLLGDAELDSDYARFEHRDRVDPRVADWAARHSVDEVLEAMAEARLPCGRCQTPAEVVDDPHVKATGMLQSVDMEAPGLEAMPVGEAPFQLSETPGKIERRAPRVGEHNGDIYGRLLGYDAAKLESLKESGMI